MLGGLSIEKLAARELATFGEAYVTEARRQLEVQGHNATGALKRSFRVEPQQRGELRVEVTMLGYGDRVNDGTPAAVVRTWMRGASSRSRYIGGLVKWAAVVRPGITQRQALSFAYAIAGVAVKTGHPTPGSRKFSSTGQRTDFLDDTLRSVDAEPFLDALADGFDTTALILP